MVSETNKNSQDQALEERLSNMHEQMAGVTSRLDQTERALDLERATREDIIKAEVERRMREAEQRIRKEIEAEYADERAVMDKERQAIDQQREEMLKTFELMQQKLVTETEQKIRKAKDEAESHFLGKMAAQTEGFLRLFSEMTRRNNADIQGYLAKFKAASEEAQAAIGNEIKTRLERIFKNEQSKNRQIAELVRMIFTQKRERFLVSEEDRTGVHNQLLASLKFNEEEEANYKKALETVKKYIIAYRNIGTGIPIFLTAVEKGSGRGKEVIQAQLANWSGHALMCDAYPGYDWLKKTGRILCRCSAMQGVSMNEL